MSGPLFKKVEWDLGNLIAAIDQGLLGLPDIQRPFVWNTIKVRDLFDSMFKGYPVGYLLLWEAPKNSGRKQIGTEMHGQDTPSTLIIDGQQRLTSLYSVMKDKPVLTKKFIEKKLAISFRPLTAEFGVTSAAHKRSPEWIDDISVLFTQSEATRRITNSFISKLSETKELSDAEEDSISTNIEKLLSLKKFPFTALEVNATTSEEDVADIFVRVNSRGQNLNQADFVLTLISVFWGEGREQLEEFCKSTREGDMLGASSFNHLIETDPDQLIRVAVGLGFNRARLKYVYLILRGKNLETGEYSVAEREKQFQILRESQAKVLDLQNWHDFLKVPVLAGYCNKSMITSANSLLNAYMLYLVGKYRYMVDSFQLRKIIASWFFMSNVTGRYSGSSETVMESDLNGLREVSNANEFEKYLRNEIAKELTNDYWSITLPNELDNSSSRNPGWFAYIASINILGAKVLFSNMRVAELLSPLVNAKKNALERHHLFPKKYLERIGYSDDKDRNHVANFALVEWKDNIEISDKAPADYIFKYKERYSEAEIKELYRFHALPEEWGKMDFPDFLRERRERMAMIIKEGFQKIEGKQ